MKAYTYIGHMVITYVAALAIVLLFESPILQLEKFVFPRKK